MTTRQAIKILSRYYLDPRRKPSATTPYTDGQYLAASARLRRAVGRAFRRWPSTPSLDVPVKWSVGPATQARARARTERRGMGRCAL